jgi:serine phosphatase RsbU (regulator of sigma subunit)
LSNPSIESGNARTPPTGATLTTGLPSPAWMPRPLRVWLGHPWLPWAPRREVPPVPAGYRRDFREEFQRETARLLPGGYLWFTGLTAALTLLLTLREGWKATVDPLLRALHQWVPPDIHTADLLALLPNFIIVGVYGVLFFRAHALGQPPANHVRAVQDALLYGTAAAMVVYAVVPYSLAPDQPWPPLSLFFFPGVLAAATMPLTDNQLRRPILPLVLLNAVLILIFAQTGWMQKIGWSVLSCAIPLPALAVAYVKHRRRLEGFTTRFYESRYGAIKKELVDARRLHEALFPPRLNVGAVRLDYQYEPMRQIGGDYLYARPAPAGGDRPDAPEGLNLLVIDVTGHGVSAALTVNRLYGEVERLYAENPRASPGEVLRALNRYVGLTLANHAMFCTALCVRVDPVRATIEYASAGHPPAFVRAAPGEVRRLDSTAPVLGVLDHTDFEPAQRAMPFPPGSVFIAYTDGAMETTNAAGEQFGVDRIAETLRSPRRPDSGWAAELLRRVDDFRLGPPRDDTLIVEVEALPIVSPEPASTSGAPEPRVSSPA